MRGSAPVEPVCCYRSHTSSVPLDPKKRRVFRWQVLLLSESESGLQNSLNKLEHFCNTWGLKVNISKTKVVVFNKSYNSKIKNLLFEIDKNKIGISKTYCYLGVDISTLVLF